MKFFKNGSKFCKTELIMYLFKSVYIYYVFKSHISSFHFQTGVVNNHHRILRSVKKMYYTSLTEMDLTAKRERKFGVNKMLKDHLAPISWVP